MAVYHYVGIVYDSDYLQHHGIIGQKWGIRRFQNADGTYTAEGKKRYGLRTDRQADRLAAYQSKEYKKAEQRYTLADRAFSKRNEKLSRKKDAALADFKMKKATRLDNRIRINKKRAKESKRISEQVLKDIKNMSYKDMQREKMIRGSSVAASVLITAGSLAVSPQTGFGIILFTDPDGNVASSRESRARRELINNRR